MRQREEVNQVYEVLLRRFLQWAQTQPNIRAVIQVGSRMRQDHPADEWADLDLMLYLTQPEFYLYNRDWLEAIAPVWLAVEARTAGNDPELLVMFKDGYNIDFVMCAVRALDWLRDNAHLDPVFQRGARVLLDRDGVAADAVAHPPRIPAHHPPSEEEFQNVCEMFAYVSVYISRQIRRGELWMAQTRDATQKGLLLRMLEWHAGVMSNWQRDTWHGGRFIEEWADMRALAAFPFIFGRYNPIDASKALLASVNLFHWLAHDVAERLEFAYPLQREVNTLNLIEETVGEPRN